MSALPVAGEGGQLPIAIHLEYIRNVADGAEGESADAVEAFHRALFLNRFGADLERCRQDREAREERLASLESRLRHAEEKLGAEEKYVAAFEEGTADDRPNLPWNGWSRAMFGVSVLAILLLLVFGVFNVSFNLLESGIVTFAEHPIRAYFWAALLPVGALGVKVGWDLLPGSRAKAVYHWLSLALGVGGVLVWVAAYASVYPNLSRTAAEQIEALDIHQDVGAESEGFLGGTTVGGVKRVDMVLVGSQAVAEIFLSAVLGIYLTQLYSRHRPVRLALNPTFAQYESERGLLEGRVASERLALAAAKGEQTKLENQLVVFVSYARSLLHREIALRRDRGRKKHLLIDEIAHELRLRLEALDAESEEGGENGEIAAGDGVSATARGNGQSSAHPRLSKESSR